MSARAVDSEISTAEQKKSPYKKRKKQMHTLVLKKPIQHRRQVLEGLSGNVVSLLYIPTITAFFEIGHLVYIKCQEATKVNVVFPE